jgi:hypothetical protein
VHLYKALNYLEYISSTRRVLRPARDIRLREIGAKFSGAQYTEDAFARYLTGMIYEELKEWSDALIAYRKAYEAYQNSAGITAVPVPRALQYDLLRMTQRHGLTAELNKYRKEFGITRFQVSPSGAAGELVFIPHNGLAPIKRERSVAVPTRASTILIRVSLPYYESHPVMVTGARVSARALANPDNGELSRSHPPTELMEDIDAIAARISLPSCPVSRCALWRAAAKRAISRAASRPPVPATTVTMPWRHSSSASVWKLRRF